MYSINTGSSTYNKVFENTTISSYVSFFGCGWNQLTTRFRKNYNDLSTLNFENTYHRISHQCGNCPLFPGPLEFSYTVDLERLPLAGVILSKENIFFVYKFKLQNILQLGIDLKNGDSIEHEEIGCLVVQAKFSKNW